MLSAAQSVLTSNCRITNEFFGNQVEVTNHGLTCWGSLLFRRLFRGSHENHGKYDRNDVLLDETSTR